MDLLKANVIRNESFYALDNESLYDTNLKRMPSDWAWRSKKVTYTTNSQAYRSPEWDQINWEESVLVLGCSFAFGLGISDEDTCSSQLSTIINKPVINLGVVGASPMTTWINSTILAYNKIKPAGVIYIWPPAHRVAELHPNQKITNYGPWNADKWGAEWIGHTTQCIEMLRYCVYNTSVLWQCPVVHYHLEHKAHDRIPGLTILKCVSEDHARDWNGTSAHPGSLSHRQWAEIMAKDLNGLW